MIDLFSYAENRPFRIDFFGDSVENIRVFDIDTQRTAEERNFVEIFPDITLGNKEEELTNLFEFAGGNSLIWVSDPEYFHKQIETIWDLAAVKGGLFSPQEYESITRSSSRVLFGPLSLSFQKGDTARNITFHTSPQPSFNKNFDLLAAEIERRKGEGYHVSIFSENPNQTERLVSIFSSLEGETYLLHLYI